MIDHLLSIIRREAARTVSQMRATSRNAIVDTFDPKTYACRVRFQPENTLSGWLPVLSQWIGNGWGLFSPVTPGDQVLVEFQQGDGYGLYEKGQVTGRFFGAVNRPLNVQSGEFWLVHKSGTAFKLTNDGKVTINGTVEIDVGNVAGTLHQLMTDLAMAVYNGHTHSDPQGGNTGVPNQQMSAATHLTQILKAN